MPRTSRRSPEATFSFFMPTTVIEKNATELKKGNFHFVNLLNDEQYQMGVEGLSTIEVLRTGMIHDRELEITEEMMKDFIRNFEEDVYGTELQVNLGHDRGGEAAGWIKALFIKKEGDITKLMATVAWTPLGVDKIKNKLYRFTSSELASQHPHHETGELMNNVLIGVALTNIPAVKGMAPVELSEEVQSFINHSNMDKLKAKFAELNAKDKLSYAEFQDFKNMAYTQPNNETAKMLSELEEKSEGAPVEEEKPADEKVEDEAKPEGEADVETEEKPAEGEAEAEKPADEETKNEGEVEGEKPEAKPEENLSEKAKMQLLSEENTKLREQIDMINLAEVVTEELCLSETRKTGFNGNKNTINRVAKFMVRLSQSQRAEFKAILAEVKTVDLTKRGDSSKPLAKLDASDENVANLAEKLMKSGTAKNITDAQKMAFEQLSAGK